MTLTALAIERCSVGTSASLLVVSGLLGNVGCGLAPKLMEFIGTTTEDSNSVWLVRNIIRIVVIVVNKCVF